MAAFQKYNQSLPVDLIDSVHRNKVALKGPVTTPIAEGFRSVNVGLRKALEDLRTGREVWRTAKADYRLAQGGRKGVIGRLDPARHVIGQV